MTEEQIRHIIDHGEGNAVEFKESGWALPNTVFESVCAFLNRQGGYILLGVKDNGTIIGVDRANVSKIKADFATISNNPSKLNPPYLLDLFEATIGNDTILYTYVPQSSQVHRCDGIVYDRVADADIKVKSDVDISRIYTRKSAYYTENQIFPYIKISDFKPGLLDKARQLIRSNTPDHPWLALPDDQFLASAGLWQLDYKTGNDGYTLAAVLLLGRDEVIHSVLPHYRTDALLRKENTDRYDDRLDIRTNLLEAYDLLMGFVGKHLPDRFYISGDQRTNVRDWIFREVVANLIVHREYTNASPAQFIIYKDGVETDNANKPIRHGPINPQKFSPFPKNPTIARFFAQLGRVEELGSGIRNITKYLTIYSPGTIPSFIDEDTFRTTIPLKLEPDGASDGVSEGVTDGVYANEKWRIVEGVIEGAIEGATKGVKEKLVHVLFVIALNEGLRIPEYQDETSYSYGSLERYLKKLRSVDLIEFRGTSANTGGYYLTSKAMEKIKK